MYRPDTSFLKKLKRLDPNLGCRYEPGHEHFVITYRRAIGQPVPVMLIEGPNGTFRWPDDRDIRKLEESDLHRVPVKERLRILARYFEEDREHRRRKAKENIRDMTKDNKIQLTRAFAKAANQGGKHNAQFRRIILTPKGQVF